MYDTAIVIDRIITSQGGNVERLLEYAKTKGMKYFKSESELGAFDSILIKRKLDVRNLIFITTYDSENIDFRADIKVCANKNPSILLGILDDFYFKYIKPYHTLDERFNDNDCLNNAGPSKMLLSDKYEYDNVNDTDAPAALATFHYVTDKHNNTAQCGGNNETEISDSEIFIRL